MIGEAGGRAGTARTLCAIAFGLLFGGGARAACAASPFVPDASVAPPAIEAGMPLADALRALERRGLTIVFSSLVVPPELAVDTAPTSTDPRSALDELLRPHGLVAVAGAGGSLVVQRAAELEGASATLAGAVRARATRTPLPGVTLLLAGTGRETTTDEGGRFRLDEVAPGVHVLDARRPGYVVESFGGLVARAGETSEIELLLQPAPFASEEIVVHPSRATLLRAEPVAAVELDRSEIMALPHLGDDVLRALELLPGVASNDLTAQFHVRGGRRDEVLLMLDGQEIYEGFHLKDFDAALSLFAASGLDGVHLTTGAFPVDYGDRMGGVLDLTSSGRFDSGRYRVALSALTLELGAAQPLPSGRGRWFVQARSGTTEVVERVFDSDQPEFWDLFARGDLDLGDASTLRLHLLASDDRYELVETGEEPKRLRTAYDTGYVWLTHQVALGSRLFVDTAISRSESDRDRRDRESDGEKELAVIDLRATTIEGIRQQWNLELGARHLTKLGLGLRRFESAYDYASEREFDSPLALLRPEPREGLFRHVDRLVDDQVEGYLSDRIRANATTTIELGLRYDRSSGARREQAWSPRAHVAWSPNERSVFRLGWGRYLQSHRTYELMIEDGDVARYPFERSEHWVVGYERRFERAGKNGLDSARIEAFHRPIETPRPRYESLLEPFDPFPEGELDRFRFAPQESEANGVELFLRGRLGAELEGWVNYTYQTVEDTIGGVEIPRSIDQRHSLNLDLSWRPAPAWSVNFAWLFHTGRPTTAISIAFLSPPAGPAPPPDDEDDDDGGEPEPEPEPIPVPVLGPLNGERLGDYHRLDLRIARVTERSWGRIVVFGDAQNLYAHANQSGVDVEYDDETGELVRKVEKWPGFVASAGIVFEF